MGKQNAKMERWHNLVPLLVGLGALACSVEHNLVAVIGGDPDASSAGTDTSAPQPSDKISFDIAEGPGEEPGISCSYPELFCTSGESECGELIQFQPASGAGYIDYPENGESASLQERSWYRRDLTMIVKYAAAYVACKTARWDFGNGGSLGLIDGSLESGANPGGYWEDTHQDGKDLTAAYYQRDTADNRARPVCEHVENGEDVFHCVGDPSLLDPWRTALFLGALFEHPDIRVVGCDGKIGPIVSDALNRLCEDGWLRQESCQNSKLSWEENDTGAGWYYSHHHHMQISMNTQ